MKKIKLILSALAMMTFVCVNTPAVAQEGAGAGTTTESRAGDDDGDDDSGKWGLAGLLGLLGLAGLRKKDDHDRVVRTPGTTR